MVNIFKEPVNKFHTIDYIKNTEEGFIVNSFFDEDSANNIYNKDILLSTNDIFNTILPPEILECYGLFSVESARAFVEYAFNINKHTITTAILTNIFNNPKDRIAYYCIKYLNINDEIHFYGTIDIPEMYEEYIEDYIDSKISKIISNIEKI